MYPDPTSIVAIALVGLFATFAWLAYQRCAREARAWYADANYVVERPRTESRDTGPKRAPARRAMLDTGRLRAPALRATGPR
ncbi:hypothetical protein [Lutibaculum baratangense]|uniref:Uncharacterized protein n=1 Tax=Lutibaculum baratangense AMV1 TaxID=631454 RepID=V4RLP1_9HYPH|nr:hypothetical protein [Lutibaculum baratangense]ESR26931.1 hypothetical protein N177_0715 [Lutibaculum baratangense AMV1]